MIARMKITTLVVSLLAVGPVAATELPDCFKSTYDAQLDLFTVKNTAKDIVNQQCVLTVGPRGGATTPSRLSAGSYMVSLANGGGGGAGGTQQRGSRGGAGGGGAGAREVVTRVDLAEGSYRLTIGAGGPGGLACVFAPYYMGGGPGWLGSPSNIVRIATGAVMAGTPGADSYARPSRAQHDRSAGLRDGHGGSGPGQTSGGHGGTSNSVTGGVVLAESGQDSRTTGAVGMGGSRGENAGRWLAGGGGTVDTGVGGIPGGNEDRTSAGGGGGATSRGDGGGGGGEKPGQPNRLPERGTLGSGGGGGEGSSSECDAGARGGHGFIALRPL